MSRIYRSRIFPRLGGEEINELAQIGSADHITYKTALNTVPWFLMIGGCIWAFTTCVKLISYATVFNALYHNDCVALTIVIANHSPYEWLQGNIWTLFADIINTLVFVWGTIVIFCKLNPAFSTIPLFLQFCFYVIGHLLFNF